MRDIRCTQSCHQKFTFMFNWEVSSITRVTPGRILRRGQRATHNSVNACLTNSLYSYLIHSTLDRSLSNRCHHFGSGLFWFDRFTFFWFSADKCRPPYIHASCWSAATGFALKLNVYINRVYSKSVLITGIRPFVVVCFADRCSINGGHQFFEDTWLGQAWISRLMAHELSRSNLINNVILISIHCCVGGVASTSIRGICKLRNLSWKAYHLSCMLPPRC